MSSDDEEGMDLMDPELVTKYKDAAVIVNQALEFVLAECKPKAKIVDICEKGDAFIKEQTANVYKKNKIERGLAYPTCISVNNVIANFSPLATDGTVLEDGDMVKIEMGCHIDGCSALVGHTHVLQEGPITGRKADVIAAANTAAEVALRLVRPGNKNNEVTEAIQKVAEAYDCNLVDYIKSHQLQQNLAEGKKLIQSRYGPETDHITESVKTAEFKENEVYAIDIVASTGDGKTRLSEEKKTTLYRRDEDVNFPLTLKVSRSLISEIKEKFSNMPFTIRSVEERNARLGIEECVKHGLLVPYPVNCQKPGEFVAQIRFTVLLMPNGSDRITSHELQELQPTKTIDDPEIKGWLALGFKKKKKKKEKKKKGTREEGEAEPVEESKTGQE